jgi:eukaryotic-like serine/threonine-protein kinase
VTDGSSTALALVGAVLNGRFRLVRLLGEGGMGAVYEADSLRGEGKRAIKMLHPEFVKEDQILQRFFAEAQATRALTHPNIAQVFESATAEDGTPYLVMELLQGIPLSSYLDQGNPIPPQHALPIIYGILQALTMAHAQRVIHRDLKPDNLFLVRDPRGAFVVKVLDFGIAQVLDAAGGMGQKTRTGVLLGTPGYMSPEQIKNSKGVDARTDLWSVGIIFYEMLTAKQPFPADNEFARLTCVLTEEVKPIEQVAPHLAAWSSFFQRALAKEPPQRFQSAEEMAQAINAVARGGTAKPATPPPSAAVPSAQSKQGQFGTVPAMASAADPRIAAPPAGQRPPEPGSVQQYSVPAWSAPTPSQNPAPYPSAQPMGPPGMPAPSHGPNNSIPTHVSGQRPPGTPAFASAVPSIEVIQPPRLTQGAAWWLVAVVAALAFGLGLSIGLLAG